MVEMPQYLETSFSCHSKYHSGVWPYQNHGYQYIMTTGCQMFSFALRTPELHGNRFWTTCSWGELCLAESVFWILETVSEVLMQSSRAEHVFEYIKWIEIFLSSFVFPTIFGNNMQLESLSLNKKIFSDTMLHASIYSWVRSLLF